MLLYNKLHKKTVFHRKNDFQLKKSRQSVSGSQVFIKKQQNCQSDNGLEVSEISVSPAEIEGEQAKSNRMK